MVKIQGNCLLFVIIAVGSVTAWAAEQTGGIRGMVYDADFDVPLASAQVSIAETGVKTVASDQGNYVFNEVAAGTYTLVFSKDGYVRHVKSNVVVSSGNMTEIDASLSGDFTDMEEFVVQDMQIGSGTEAALLDLRLESPALMDSVGSDLMSRAGASDAAAALRLVSGATVQDGKYATVRGLPDRYVNSQLNGIRLPTADIDKRAVQLDQFPAAMIESIQVSKTFTPDQQGDASGGAVNIVLKSIPDQSSVNVGGQYSWNTLVQKASGEFLSYRDGGVNAWGRDYDRDIQTDRLGDNWGGSVGGVPTDPPTDYKWSVAAGGKHVFENGMKLGAFGSFFYERSVSYQEGFDDSYWLEPGRSEMTPRFSQGMPTSGNFYTSLYDITKSSQQVQWGGMGVLGLELEDHKYTLAKIYTRTTEDTVTFAENTRGKESLHKYWPNLYNSTYENYEPYNHLHPGNNAGKNASPYTRTETLEYSERTTDTLQLAGRHTLPDLEWQIGNLFSTLRPEVDWSISSSTATFYEPDKRFFGESWTGPFRRSGGRIGPATHGPLKADSNFLIGNLQRTWKDITEDSSQYSANFKLPFEQWSGDEGYFKFGFFHDQVERTYNQDSFSNLNDNTGWQADWEQRWSQVFPEQNHPVSAADIDVDYDGSQKISAWYYMADVPLSSWLNIIGGARFEKTNLEIINAPESDVTWVPSTAAGPTKLNPGAADVSFKQRNVLPSIGFQLKPWEKVTLRGSYSETIARQTFKELTPIMQMEYLGADVFIGNPNLQMSSLKNYDLRLDYNPFSGSLISVSWFYKEVTNPIEYIQQFSTFAYTYPVNFPEGELSGYELEMRQELGRFWDSLAGVSVGGNATFIHSEVTLPDDEARVLADAGAPMPKRDMMNAPEYLYNLFTNYDIESTGTQLSLFYTVRGDTLVAGAGQSDNNFIPSIYETQYGTLNFSLTQKLGEIWKLRFQAKNLLDPDIETVYRSKYIGGDVTKSSYNKGMDFSISLSATF